MEPIPIGNGRYLLSSTEFTVVLRQDLSLEKVYLWVRDKAVDITQFVKGYKLELHNISIDLSRWVELGIALTCRIAPDIETYAAMAREWGLDVINGAKLVIAFSGGKDSSVNCLVLRKLSDSLNLDLRVVYVHMPFLEPEAYIDEANRIASRIGLDIEVLEPHRNVVLRYLKEQGLPYRRMRWCTYLKTWPMRRYMKSVGARYVAIGDRMWETFKRFRRLLPLVERRKLVRKRTVYVVCPLTLLDVVSACRSMEAVHRGYLEGFSRVSCLYCPYKSAYELRLRPSYSVEDPGLIEDMLRLEWRRWYREYVAWQDFVDEHLWRYTPRTASMFVSIKSVVDRLADKYGLEMRCASDFAEWYRHLWIQGVQDIEVVDIDTLLQLGKDMAKRFEKI